MSQEDEEEQDVTHYQASIPIDQDSFLRQACPGCGLQFKIKTNPENLSSLLAPAFRRIEQDYDLILSVSNTQTDELSQLTCPYCSHTYEAQDFLPNELSTYLVRWVEREFVYPKLKQFQEELDSIFGKGSHRSRKSLFSIEITLEHDDIYLPVQPIAGPELPDMGKVKLLCCRKDIKIAEGWKEKISCPYCLRELILT